MPQDALAGHFTVFDVGDEHRIHPPRPALDRGGCPRIERAGLAGDLIQGVAQGPADREAEPGADATGASQTAVAVVASYDQRAEGPRVGA